MSPNHETNTAILLIIRNHVHRITCIDLVNVPGPLLQDSLTCNLILLPGYLAERRLAFRYGKWVCFPGRQPHGPHSRSPLIWRITNVMNTSSVPAWAPLVPFEKIYNPYRLHTKNLGARGGLGQTWSWQRAPMPLPHLHSVILMSRLPPPKSIGPYGNVQIWNYFKWVPV